MSDKDGEKIKVVWDFGNNRKSYKEETRHKYKKTGNFNASLKVFDGAEEIIKNFRVEVKNFPKLDVEIISFCPNPAGKDTEYEWIEIRNNEGKEIDLENWSLANGWDNLYNHPIREDFKIKAGETKILTRKICAFALNNKRSRLELRYPNGKVADRVSYEKEKIEENEIYRKIEGNWHWILETFNLETEKEIEKIFLTGENDWEIFQEKYSQNPAWQAKIAARLALINLGTSISFSNFQNSAKALEDTSEKTPIYKNHKHWAQKIVDDFGIFFNQKISLFFLKLSP